MQRRPWTAYQDQILKTLFQKVQLNKWSLIAQQMQTEYNLPLRTGKQCRERYNNHLSPDNVKDGWSLEQQKLLFDLHNQMGNKWAIIAAQIKGRTDNGVKNHFFAKLRKAMRRINKLIKDRFKKKLKEVKINVLYKIVEANQEKFRKEPLCSAEVSEFSCVLKNNILKLAEQSSTIDDSEFSQLISEIHNFSKIYKRKPKQLRRIPKNNQDYLEKESISKESDSANSEDEDSQDEIKRSGTKAPSFIKKIEDEQTEKRNLRSATLKVALEDVGEEPKGEAQNILNGIMIEDESRSVFGVPMMHRRRSESSEMLFEDNSRHYSQFFQDSGLPFSFPPNRKFPSFLKKSDCEDSFNNSER